MYTLQLIENLSPNDQNIIIRLTNELDKNIIPLSKKINASTTIDSNNDISSIDIKQTTIPSSEKSNENFLKESDNNIPHDALLSEIQLSNQQEPPVLKDKTEINEKETRNVHVSWFERMLSNKPYPLIITFSREEKVVYASVISVISGEKISETKSIISLNIDEPLYVKPEFPGCIVTPSESKVLLSSSDKEVQFYITPLVIGKLHSKICIIQNNSVIQQISLPTKVIQHRLSKILTLIGSISGILPGLFAFFLNEPLDQFMEARFKTYLPILLGTGFTLPIIFMIIFFGLAGIFYFIQQPKKQTITLFLPQ